MTATLPPEPDSLAALPLPLPHARATSLISAPELAEALEIPLSRRRCRSECRDGAGRTEFATTALGGLAVVSGRTTPLSTRLDHNDNLAVKLIVSGVAAYTEGSSTTLETAGGLLAFPNRGGLLSVNHCAGIAFELERPRLARTMHLVSGGLGLREGTDPFSLGHGVPGGGRSALLLQSFFRFVDSLLAEDPWLPEALGLEDQLYRLFVLDDLKARGLRPQALRGGTEGGGSARILDALVAFIADNLHRPLTLTDLHQCSGYSTRQLQYLFQARFQCTPMQFVRRQRLQAALQALEDAGPGDSVTRIARRFGYRHAGNFAADFRRHHGVTPTQILRASAPVSRSSAGWDGGPDHAAADGGL